MWEGLPGTLPRVRHVAKELRQGQTGSFSGPTCLHHPLQVPLKEQKASEGLPNPLPRVKHAAEQDRNIMEKGTRAFVSYVRGYREHQVRIPACQSLDQVNIRMSLQCWSGEVFQIDAESALAPYGTVIYAGVHAAIKV